MRTLSNTRLCLAAALATLFAASPASAQAPPPQVPATFYGTLTVDGVPARNGAVVRAFVNGNDCTQAGSGGAVFEGGRTHYVIPVVHETQVPGCGTDGAEITFTVDGAAAAPGGTWRAGPFELNLTAGPPPAEATRQPVPSVPVDEPGGNGAVIAVTAVALAALVAGGALFARRKWKGKGAA